MLGAAFSTATTRVFVDGVDVVGLSSEVSSLRRQVQALIDALPSIPPSDSLTAEPTPVPSDAPSTLAPSTAPSGSPTVTAVVHTGDVQLGAGCAFSSAYYTSLNVITGEWTMNGCQNAVTLDIAPFGGWFGSFMNLERIDKQLKIYGNYNLATLGAAFSNLVQLGAGLPAGAPALLIEVNPLLRTLGTAFAALRRISGTLSIHNNRLSSHHPNVLTNFEALRNLECHVRTSTRALVVPTRLP